MLNVFDSSFVFPDFVVVCFGSLAVRKAAYGYVYNIHCVTLLYNIEHQIHPWTMQWKTWKGCFIMKDNNIDNLHNLYHKQDNNFTKPFFPSFSGGGGKMDLFLDFLIKRLFERH